jgi:hypothetical protein
MIKINGVFLQSNDKDELINECQLLAKEYQIPWKDEYDNHLREWVDNRLNVRHFDSLDALVVGMPVFIKGEQKPETTSVSIEEMKEAKRLRRVHRLGKIFELCTNQVTAIAPGIHQLSPDQLLPLDHHWNTPGGEQRQRWHRTTGGQYVQLKPKGEASETVISAFGDPQNPSMVYWRDGRQLGHRYQATRRKNRTESKTPHPKYSQNSNPNRTYGGKTKSPTGKYIIKGMADGHAIPVKDDQYNLDAKEAKNIPSADRHPHNMYWEHQKFGKDVRGKYFEKYAYDNESWWLQINQFSTYESPRQLPTDEGNASSPKTAIVADRIHLLAYRHTEPEHARIGYYQFNNKREANYNNLDFRIQYGNYREEEGVSWHSLQKEFVVAFHPHRAKLGRSPKVYKTKMNVTEQHARANRVVDANQFPRAQVLTRETLLPDAQVQFRETKKMIKNYQSPPESPVYLSRQEDKRERKKILAGVHFEGEELENTSDGFSFISSIDAHHEGGCGATILNIKSGKLWKSRKKDEKQLEKKQIERKDQQPLHLVDKTSTTQLFISTLSNVEPNAIPLNSGAYEDDQLKTPERKIGIFRARGAAIESLSQPLSLSSDPLLPSIASPTSTPVSSSPPTSPLNYNISFDEWGVNVDREVDGVVTLEEMEHKKSRDAKRALESLEEQEEKHADFVASEMDLIESMEQQSRFEYYEQQQNEIYEAEREKKKGSRIAIAPKDAKAVGEDQTATRDPVSLLPLLLVGQQESSLPKSNVKESKSDPKVGEGDNLSNKELTTQGDQNVQNNSISSSVAILLSLSEVPAEGEQFSLIGLSNEQLNYIKLFEECEIIGNSQKGADQLQIFYQAHLDRGMQILRLCRNPCSGNLTNLKQAEAHFFTIIRMMRDNNKEISREVISFYRECQKRIEELPLVRLQLFAVTDDIEDDTIKELRTDLNGAARNKSPTPKLLAAASRFVGGSKNPITNGNRPTIGEDNSSLKPFGRR